MRILIQMGDPYCKENPAAKRIKTFCQVWTQLGHQVTILTPQCDENMRAIGSVHVCPTVKLKRKTKINRTLNGLIFSASSFLISLGIGHADVVLTTSPPPLISLSGWLIARVKRAKLVYDVRDIWPDVALEMGSFPPTSVYARVFAFIRNFMLHHAELVTTVSPGKVKKLQGYNPKGKVIEITNGLDEEFLSVAEDERVASQFGIDRVFTCVYIGNLGLAQGLNQLLHIARNAKREDLNAQFLLFGKGAEEALLRDMVNNERLDNVHFAGQISNDEIYSVLKYAQMSFVSLVNGNLRDSVPTKIFEALGVGCPVLLAAEGDAVDILREGGLGIVAHPNDDDALWKAFLQLYNGLPEVLIHRDEARRLMLEKYSRQKAARKLENILRGEV